MKLKPFYSTLLAMLGLLIATSSSHADDQPAKMSKEMQAHMAKARKAGSAGPGHAIFKNLEGTWSVESTAWMQPGAAPAKSTGSSSMKLVLGGRFLEQTFTGNWHGHPFEGIGFIGYDNVRKEYTSTWMDNMSTGMTQSTGKYNAATKTVSETGTFSCPFANDPNKWFRSEWKLTNKDNHTFTMYVKDSAGKEFKSMEIVYKRSK